MSNWKSMDFFSRILPCIISFTSSISLRRLKSCWIRWKAPVSMSLMSITLLNKFNNKREAAVDCCKNFFWRPFRFSRISSRCIPVMMLSGVLISWLRLTKKVSLTFLTFSACSRAFFSSFSYPFCRETKLSASASHFFRCLIRCNTLVWSWAKYCKKIRSRSLTVACDLR